VPGTGLVLATIRYDSTGAMADVEVITESMLEVMRTRVAQAVRSAARPRAEPRHRVHLFIGEGTVHVRRVRGFRTCGPRILDPDWLASQLRAEAPALKLARPVRVRLFVRVGADGAAREVRVADSSGNPDADAAAVRVMTGASYAPAVAEGVPVPVWASFPVTFRPAPRARR